MTDEYKEAYQHTRDRLRERWSLDLTPEEYEGLMTQIRDGSIKTGFARCKKTAIHIVQTTRGKCVVAYRDGLIRTAYPSSYPTPKRALEAFERTYKKVQQDVSL